jgi:hypothetical protein
MGAGEGSWRWGGSRALGLIVKGLRDRERGSELETGLVDHAETLKRGIWREVSLGRTCEGMGVRAR